MTATVFDIDNGQFYNLHPGVAEDEASIVKVDILATYLWQGMKVPAAISSAQQSVIQSMIEESDNDSATSLWDAVGGTAAIASFDHAAGLSSTTPSTCVVCPGFPWPGWGLTSTTSADQVNLLRQLVLPSPILSSAERQYELGLMEQVAPDEAWGITGGVPSGVTVALKNGWLPLSGEVDWQVNSMGWVDGDGRDYLIAVMSNQAPTEQYGIDTIDTLSADCWNALGS